MVSPFLKKAAFKSCAAATAGAMTIGLAAPSANAAATLGDNTPRLVDASGNVNPTAVVQALIDVLQAYAEGNPPARFPEELRTLIPGLDQVGPALLAFLGSERNIAFLQSLNFGFILDALGINIPGLDELLPIPPTIPGIDIDLPINVITTGPPFGALALLGLNPFWVPAFPDAIAREINGTPYSDINLNFEIDNPLFNPNSIVCQIGLCGPPVITAPLSVDNLRIPIVLGFGLGSLAAGMAYPQVVADLPNQPGGTGEGAAAGSSLTILPLILLRNPGRANGGLAARFGSFFDLVGLNTVTPNVDVEQSGNAVLVPLKLDATVEYDPLSDFPAWVNPFSLANSAAAFAFPTYVLRRTDIDSIQTLLGQLIGPVLGGALGNVASAAIGNGVTVSGLPIVGSLTLPRALLLPIVEGLLGIDIPNQGFAALNEYLTARSNALPLLEPFRLPVDLLNVLAGGNYFSNPFADALEPALRILVNLGYTDVDQENGYQRSLDQAGLNANSGGVPFGTLPDNVDWGRVLTDVFNAFVAGVQQEFFSGGIPGFDPTGSQPNPLTALQDLFTPTPPGAAGNEFTQLPAANSLPNAANSSRTLNAPEGPTTQAVSTGTNPEGVTQQDSSPTRSASQVPAAPDTSVTPTKEVTPPVEEAAPAREEAAPTDSDAVDQSATQEKGPLVDVETGTGNSATGTTDTTTRDVTSGTAKQQDEVGDVGSANDGATDGATSTTNTNGASKTSTSASTSKSDAGSSTDGDSSTGGGTK